MQRDCVQLRLAGFIFVTAFVLLSKITFLQAQDFESKAKQALLIEHSTGTILYSKDADAQIPPASLAKIMTMELVFNALSTGELKLEDTFNVSEYAWRTGGAPSRTSTMFAELGSDIPVEDLIRGAIVHSGNDSCIILAEGMYGSSDAFAEKMTMRAKDIGMLRSSFGNPTGLPHPQSRVTMTDMITLSRHIYDNYPQFYPYFGEVEFIWNDIRQFNRLPLLNANMGVDGLKTGFTEESGYSIVSSVEQGNRRLFVALSGLEDKEQRISETKRILKWGLENFSDRPVFNAGEIIGSIGVFGGNISEVDVAPEEPITIYLSKQHKDPLKARIVYDWPLKAPIRKGDQVAQVRIWAGETLSRTMPLYAQSDVGEGSLTQKALDGLIELVQFWH